MMDDLKSLADLAGMMWVYALIGAFIAMIAESAKPKADESGEPPKRGLIGVVIGIAGMATLFMLAVHGYWSAFAVQAQSEMVLALGVVFVVAIVASIVGLVFAKAPGISPVLHAIAPFLTLAVFAFTAYVTWESVRAALDLYVLQNL
jgi:hypothetical protein